MESDVKEIDLSKTDWNNLSLEDFQNLTEKITTRNKIIKDSKERKKRTILEYVPVEIRGNSYSLSTTQVERLKSMKSDKSKEKLIDEIIRTHTPIEVL